MNLCIILFFSLITLNSTLKLTSAACHVDDQTGLLAFKSGITHDPSGMLSSWKSGTDCCSWAGITCLSGNRVTALSLSGQLNKPNTFLSGTISPSLVKVQNLDGIYLQDLRNITGKFPDLLLFGLPKLQFVYIENNKISGQIPTNIGKLTQLGALSFAGNQLTGPIPSSISELIQLSQLKLGNNFLTGAIPAGISKLKQLTFLSLKHNQLSGQIPPSLSSLSTLIVLELSHNKLTGNLPNSIQSLAPHLRFLELGHNALTGQIPDFISKFTALDTLDLSWNKFVGVVPKSFANLTKIFNLDLSHNYLVDPFPVLNVKGIESLALSYNGFNLKQIPTWVTSSPIIYSLKLARCGIKMNLDSWKPKQTYFYDYIDLSENEISGSPVSLLNRTDFLVGFWSSGNKLKFDLRKLKIAKTLQKLDLGRNLVYGNVPNTVLGVKSLNVSYNELCGKLPAGATKYPVSAFAGNGCLCGSPLPPACACNCGEA